MSALRSVGKAAGGFFFTTFLSLLIFMQIIAQFTAYKTLRPVIVDVLEQQLNLTSEELNSTYTVLFYQCQESRNETINIESLELKCSDVSRITYTDLPELIGNTTFDKIYFKKYDCSFFECVQLQGEEKFLFFMSKQANEFFEKTIVYLGIVTVLSAFILVAATETWSGRAKAIGTSLVFVGMFCFLMPIIKGYATQQLPEEMSTKISPIINQIFDPILSKLLIVFVVGVILTAAGFVLGYLTKRKETKKE